MSIRLHRETHPSISGFWSYIEEREAIRIHRADGCARPWTEDLLLHKYRFCNVRRADDYGTQWFVKQAAGWPSYSGANHFADRLWRAVLYRSINNIEYFERIAGGIFGYGEWDANEREIADAILHAPNPNSQAYIILGASNRDSRKVKLLRYLAKNRLRLPYLATHIQEAKSLEVVWKHLQEFDGVGGFIAMQVYRDLILIGQLPWSDNDFAYMGPGAQKALRELISGGNLLGYGPENSYYVQSALCREMFENQPPEWRLSLCEVQHNLCEYGKWLRLRNNRGRRRHFTPREELVHAG